jgi:cysteine-rich repeat protein
MFHRLGLALLLVGLVLLPAAATAQPAPDANSVLVLTSVDGGGSFSASAAAQGFTVVPASDAEWAARSAADFATFKAIILGDPTCGGTPPAAAEGNAAVWGSVIDGPILIIGTDERFHFGQGGSQLIDSGIGFATSGAAGETGAYISTSCYYDGTPVNTPVPLLAGLGVFLAGPTGGCFNDAHIVAVHPALAGSTDVTLSNWGCSVHNVWNSFPSASFLPLAIAENIAGPGNLTFADGTNGIPYILASGGGITPVGCGNGILEPPEECDDGNTTSGDGCSSFCTIEGGGGPAVVPTLSPWMLALFGIALAGAGLFVVHRFHS